MRTNRLFAWVLIGGCLFVAAVLLLASLVPYSWVVDLMSAEFEAELADNPEGYVQDKYSYEGHIALSIMAALAGLVAGALGSVFYVLRSRIGLPPLPAPLRQLSLPECYLLGGVLLLLLVWNALTLPVITYDEAFTYFNFIHKGPAVSLLYYPTTNNHILFSLLASAIDLFTGGLLPRLSMRLVALGATVAHLLLAFALLRRFFPFALALLGMSLYALCWNVFAFSLAGRGYPLMWACLLAACYAWLVWVDSSGTRWPAWWVMLIASLLGGWTILVYAIPLLGLGMAWLGFIFYKKAWQQLWPLALLTGSVALGWLILYTPVMVANGSQAVLGNPNVTDQAWGGSLTELWHTYAFGWRAATGLPFLLILLLAAVVIVAISWQRMPRPTPLFWLCMGLGLAPLAFMLLTGTLPFGRLLGFLALPYTVLLLTLLAFFWREWPNARTPALIAVGLFGLGLHLSVLNFNYGPVAVVDGFDADAGRYAVIRQLGDDNPRAYAEDAYIPLIRYSNYAEGTGITITWEQCDPNVTVHFTDVPPVEGEPYEWAYDGQAPDCQGVYYYEERY